MARMLLMFFVAWKWLQGAQWSPPTEWLKCCICSICLLLLGGSIYPSPFVPELIFLIHSPELKKYSYFPFFSINNTAKLEWVKIYSYFSFFFQLIIQLPSMHSCLGGYWDATLVKYLPWIFSIPNVQIGTFHPIIPIGYCYLFILVASWLMATPSTPTRGTEEISVERTTGTTGYVHTV